MTSLKKIGLGLIAAVAILLVVAFLLPSTWHVEESIVINAKPRTIYPLVSNFKNWQSWAPWNKEMDPTAEYRFEGPEQGVGAKQFWSGKKIGNGNLLISKASEQTGIEYDLFFTDTQMSSKGFIRFDEIDGTTKVTWADQGDLGNNPFKRYMGLMINYMNAKDFKKGLANLKALAESTKEEPEAHVAPGNNEDQKALEAKNEDDN